MVQNNALNKSSPDFTVDNLFLDGNTISSLNTNGNINFTPDGSGDVYVTRDNPGTIDFVVENTDNSGSSSGSIVHIKVADTTAGSCFAKMTKGSSRAWAWGMSDSTNEDMRLNTAAGSTVSPGSGTNVWQMTAAGERTMPLQPAFQGSLTAPDNNVTGNGSSYTLGSGNALVEIFDNGGDFNPGGAGTATFTSPVTGNYFLGITVIGKQTTSTTRQQTTIITSNRSYQCNSIPNTTTSGNVDSYVHFSILADMDAADTATVTYVVSGLGGDTVDVGGSPPTRFFGNLVS